MDRLGLGYASFVDEHQALLFCSIFADALSIGLRRLDAITHAAIRRACDPRGAAGRAFDLSALVESAARPRLRQRLAADCSPPAGE